MIQPGLMIFESGNYFNPGQLNPFVFPLAIQPPKNAMGAVQRAWSSPKLSGPTELAPNFQGVSPCEMDEAQLCL